MRFLFINGVNLNMTGQREKGVYGERTLDEINAQISRLLSGHDCEFYQSNVEGEICSRLHAAGSEGFDGVILNAGAYTHYSYAIRDAIAAISTPVVEVHMSNVHAREQFRRDSVISPVCRGVIAGFGMASYVLAAQSFIILQS